MDLFAAAEAARLEKMERAARGGRVRSGPVSREIAPAGAPRAGEEWTVSQLNHAARELLEAGFPPLWIAGEVANFTRARSGHCYFTLRDEGAQVRCVMWRDDARRLPTTPDEGMAVRALGRLTLYPARGDVQLVVTQLEARGEGLWKLALERLRKKLEGEGLTARARKRPLPRFPAVIGVVTSPTGAVFHDIVNVIRRRAPWTRVVLAGCRVQGDGAANEIAASIRRLCSGASPDVIIVGRGGGSMEDLWAFNEELVARAIAACPVPVISAVGHETDITIADLVADVRAPTPSAAAEAAVPDRVELMRNLQRDGWRLSRGIATVLGRAQEAVQVGKAGLHQAGERLVDGRRERVRIAARQLEALSPLAAFARGYAIPLSEEGRMLRSTADFPARSRFRLRIRDGEVACTVTEPATTGSSPQPDEA